MAVCCTFSPDRLTFNDSNNKWQFDDCLDEGVWKYDAHRLALSSAVFIDNKSAAGIEGQELAFLNMLQEYTVLDSLSWTTKLTLPVSHIACPRAVARKTWRGSGPVSTSMWMQPSGKLATEAVTESWLPRNSLKWDKTRPQWTWFGVRYVCLGTRVLNADGLQRSSNILST